MPWKILPSRSSLLLLPSIGLILVHGALCACFVAVSMHDQGTGSSFLSEKVTDIFLRHRSVPTLKARQRRPMKQILSLYPLQRHSPFITRQHSCAGSAGFSYLTFDSHQDWYSLWYCFSRYSLKRNYLVPWSYSYEHGQLWSQLALSVRTHY